MSGLCYWLMSPYKFYYVCGPLRIPSWMCPCGILQILAIPLSIVRHVIKKK